MAVLNIEQGPRSISSPTRRPVAVDRRVEQFRARKAAGILDLRHSRPRPPATSTSGLSITSYEVDLFGRVRSLTHAALENYVAQEQARRSRAVEPNRRGSQTPI